MAGKKLLYALVFTLMSMPLLAQKAPGFTGTVLTCGNNKIKLDTLNTISSSFFTDSLITLVAENHYPESRFEVAFFPEKDPPFVTWYAVNDTTGMALCSNINFQKKLAVQGMLYITHLNKGMSIHKYIINVL